MADEKKPKKVKITSPKGTLRYPWLNRPNTRFNPKGDFSVDLVVPQEEASALMAQLDTLAEEAYEMAVAQCKEKAKNPKQLEQMLGKISRNDPYQVEYDDDGDETGNVIFKIKNKAQVEGKDGKVIDLSPKLFDAKGKPIDRAKVNVFGGSTGKVAFSINPYFVPATNACGISLQLQAVQVLELVSSSGGDASAYGFGEEDGYEGNFGGEGDAPEAPPHTSEEAPNTDF